jgi:hypothetical protein
MIVLIIVVPIVASPAALVEGPGTTSYTRDTTYYYFIVSVIDFRESDHSANLSIGFAAHFPIRNGPPGVFGLNLVNYHSGREDSANEETNGTCANVACTDAYWNFNFFLRFHGFGLTDMYPYDSWMFNLTLTTPLLFAANVNNTEIDPPKIEHSWLASQMV